MNLNMKKNESGTSIRIGEVRFSFPHVFEAYKPEGSEYEKYSVSILIPKDNEEALKLVNNGIAAAAKLGAEKYWNGKIPATLKKPLRDGEERDEDPAYEGMMFLNASNRRKPGVQVLEEGIRYDANGPEDFYAGCYGGVTLEFYPFNKNGNKGVAVSLGNCIKTRDGERLSGGGASSDDDFGDLG